jgi:LuxR family transcriptional regulator, quorum-sensing system regulator CciR
MKPAPSSKDLQEAYRNFSACDDLIAAAGGLMNIGHCIRMPHPAVIDDYSSSRLLKVEDGRALTSVLGWEPEFVDQWLQQKLHLISPIAAVCRMSTKPFAWDAETVARAIMKASSRTPIRWPLMPAQGFYGGITVPIHLPRGRTGSVSWYSRDQAVDVWAVLAEHGDLLRLTGQRFMDLVYAVRDEREASPDAPLALSERELECLTWAALGRTDAEIGSVIHRSPATARFHIDNAVRKLGARNRTQAVAIAAQRGLIHPLDSLDSPPAPRTHENASFAPPESP